MEPLSDLEKNIFNCHLASSRSAVNKPFKLRKKFDNIDDSTRYYLGRLMVFFQKFPEINMRDYFEAPHKVYSDSAYYDLAYFASPKGVKTYSLYKKQRNLSDLDSQLDFVKEGIKFIGEFCMENGLTLEEYIEGGELPLWLTHAKENHLVPATLFIVPNVVDRVAQMGPELAELYLGEFGLNIRNQKIYYIKSQKLKPYIEKITPKLKQLLENSKN